MQIYSGYIYYAIVCANKMQKYFKNNFCDKRNALIYNDLHRKKNLLFYS